MQEDGAENIPNKEPDFVDYGGSTEYEERVCELPPSDVYGWPAKPSDYCYYPATFKSMLGMAGDGNSSSTNTIIGREVFNINSIMHYYPHRYETYKK